MNSALEFRLDEAVELLGRTPALLRAMLGGLNERWARNNHGPDTFSPFDVVGHLIHGERTDWMVRVRCILEHGESRPFEPFDRFAMYAASRGKTIDWLLSELEALRKKNLEDLRALRLTPAQLRLKGLHPALGSVTLEELLCPCVNFGSSGRGCANSVQSSGALLRFQGSTAIDPSTYTDSAVLSATEMPPTATAVFLQGSASQSAGITFGDGVRCASGLLVRLGVEIASSGAAQYPGPGDPSVSERGGIALSSGQTRYYQTYYRDPDPTFCPPATFNVTNGLRIVW